VLDCLRLMGRSMVNMGSWAALGNRGAHRHQPPQAWNAWCGSPLSKTLLALLSLTCWPQESCCKANVCTYRSQQPTSHTSHAHARLLGCSGMAEQCHIHSDARTVRTTANSFIHEPQPQSQ
jgi:hypothetical protein